MKSNKAIQALSWIGTLSLMMCPYLLNYRVGFVLGAIGVVLITPTCIKNKQWSLVALNFSSFVGYSLQVFNII